MVSQELELVLDAKALLAEGPSWDSQRKSLYWVDILANKFCRWDPRTGVNEEFPVGESVGAVVPNIDGDVLLVTKDGFKRYEFATKQLIPIVDPEEHLPGNRFNDGKCDPCGRFWAGTMDHAEKGVTGALYCLDKDHSCRKMFEGVGISNGMDWSPDKKHMYYIDSMSQKILCFNFDLAEGRISEPSVLIDFKDEEGLPDGMTVDEEGMLWIAHWDGWQVSRWNPYTKQRLGTIHVPVARVTSCAFGGDELDTLYITTASVGLTSTELKNQPFSGGIFAIKLKVKGISRGPCKL